MTYDTNTPNAAQSPGLFPSGNNVNFARLKTIINADHVFNDTAQSTDGVHRQSTMIARAMPGSLPGGTNSILYTWLDGFGQAQLRFYNGTKDFQLTPPDILYPIRIVGTQSVTGNTTITIYPDPGFRWAGTAWAMVQNNNRYNFYSALRSGSNDLEVLSTNSGSGFPNRPTLSFNSNDLQIKNNDSATANLVWSLIINRIS
jgi:hypothetical protein